MTKSSKKIKKLKDWLGKTAFASLIADICIAIVTLSSSAIGKQAVIDVLFVINYILTAIVVVALILMANIAILSHRKLSWISRLFIFRNR